MAEVLSTLSSTGTEGTPTNGGARYTSIVDWENAQQTSTAGGDTAVLECYKGTTVSGNWQADGSLNEAVTVAGWTTGPTNNVTIRPAAGQGHGGVPGAGFVMSNSVNNATVISCNQGYVAFEGLETSKSIAGAGFWLGNTSIPRFTTYAKNCISSHSTQSNATACFTGVYTSFINCRSIVNNGSGVGFKQQVSGRGAQFYNCQVTGTYIGYQSAGGANFSDTTITLINCLAYGSSSADFTLNSFFSDSSNNASGDATAPGTSPQTGITTADFADYAGGDYSPASGGKLDGTGADLSADFTDDIAGALRTVPWTIGAYIVAGGPPPVGIQEMYIKDGGIFVKYTPHVKVGGTFQEVDAYVLESGVWVPVHEK